ncbi:TraB/GumN family protein [Novosphingobium aquimarinum]|uniref:TraB/GumN family protein n=1 Tax=Novosphingobium aquimarinum TaxID=2682494 RepID=UPI0018DDFDD8|nr:TraB/GumN family protein [Novosphingobium aquimarinum]
MDTTHRRFPLFRAVLLLAALLLPGTALHAEQVAPTSEAGAAARNTDGTSAVTIEESVDPAAPTPSAAHPALWKVADADTTIWLFGTVHILPPDIDWFNGPVAEAFDHSDQLVTEIIDPGPARMSALITEKATRLPGSTLRDTLEPEDRAEYEAALTDLAVPVTAFDRFEAWYAAVGLSTLPLMQLGYATDNGVEKALVARGDKRAMAHIGLETPDYQIGLFDTLPEPTQERYLASVLDQLPTIKTDLAAMVDSWKKGDADELAALINDAESDAELLEILLIRRNRAWAGWIGKRLEQPGTVFIAVGAGHLAGVGSVQDQLAATGIEAKRVQ